jgi:short-subunit dehydrogenase
MKKYYGDVVLITGASSGIGKAIAEALVKLGYKVYGTSRKQESGKFVEVIPQANKNSGFLRMLQLDVCSEESVENAVNLVLNKEGRIDILINNAGFGIAGSIEDTTVEEAFSQFDTNFFGVLRMCRKVIPSMRANKNGLILNISSVAGLISVPFQSMYSASKYAVEALTEALRIEVKHFGIKVSMVEPGDTKTGFTDKRIYVAASAEESAYNEKFMKSIKTMEVSEMKGPGPHKIVQAAVKIINMKNPPIRITAGFSYKVIVFLKRLLPARLVSYVVSKIY